jgi:hypothetical protein
MSTFTRRARRRAKVGVNVQIWGETPEAEPVKELRLRLKQAGYGVTVYAVDEDGNPLPSGNLVCFDNKRGFYRCPGANPAIGLDLDKNGRIKDNSIAR